MRVYVGMIKHWSLRQPRNVDIARNLRTCFQLTSRKEEFQPLINVMKSSLPLSAFAHIFFRIHRHKYLNSVLKKQEKKKISSVLIEFRAIRGKQKVKRQECCDTCYCHRVSQWDEPGLRATAFQKLLFFVFFKHVFK